jgi:hypothetical protein
MDTVSDLPENCEYPRVNYAILDATYDHNKGEPTETFD